MNFENKLRILNQNNVEFAFYYRKGNLKPVFIHNQLLFRSASLIKIPLLLAWIELEKQGAVSREELCNLDDEDQVQGAGFSSFFHTRILTYHDVLLMMIANSDNLCTNLVIKKMGMERLQTILHETLLLSNTKCERKLMDFSARDQGLDNWIDAEECVRFFSLISNLDDSNQKWIKTLLSTNTDGALLMRNLVRDSVTFYHKTGSLTGVLHDWGFTDSCELFLLTQNVKDEPVVYKVFGTLGQLCLMDSTTR